MENWIVVQQKLVPDLLEQMRTRYRILRYVAFSQPIGRRSLAQNLQSTERILRSEVDFLKEQGLVLVEASGVSLTDAGRKLLQDLDGMIRVMDGRSELEEQLSNILKIPHVVIVPGEADTDPLVKQELGYQASLIVKQRLSDGDVLAVTGGSTVASVAERMPKSIPPVSIEVVPARGGMGQQVESQANSIAAKMAEKLGGTYRMLHVPDTLSQHTYEMLLSEPQVRDTLERIRQARMVIHGIGQAMVMARRRGAEEEFLQQLQQTGAVAEAFGYYFNPDGTIVHEMSILGLRMDDLEQVETIISVAAGRQKADAILAVARGMRQDVLITDEGCADEIRKRITEEEMKK